MGLIYTRNLRQDATYFPSEGTNGFGDPLFGDPVAVKVRWQDKAELFRDTQAREVVSSAIVYVSQEVEVGGRLGLGTLTDPNDAREIRQRGTSPDLRNDKVLVKAWL